jgi:tRNA modification GTPase
VLTPQYTIAAAATAPGRGSVGIIRISGPLAYQLSKIITKKDLKPRFAHLTDFYHPQTNQVIDQGLAIFFPNPHSFTGEDVLELQGHGGPVVLDLLLTAVTSIDNIRLAKPGEFSERAFLNDKLDLAQAEAIADLINATSEQAARNAVKSLQGVFSEKIHDLVDKITKIRIYIEAAIDFPEEEIDFLGDKTLFLGLDDIQQTLRTIFEEAKQGVLLREGMTIVIAGRPNAGKSSLLNALAGKESAIVTDIEGTTRDLLREEIHIDGMPLHIIDTAGLREGGDEVEKIGMARAWDEILKADRILLLLDANKLSLSDTLDKLLPQFVENDDDQTIDYTRFTIIYNKVDLLDEATSLVKQHQQLEHLQHIPTISISAKTKLGLSELKDHLKSCVGYQQVSEGSFTARRRHLDSLIAANNNIQLAKEQLSVGAGELVAEDLRQAQQSLGEITGEVTADDLLGKIFSSFCIGK